MCASVPRCMVRRLFVQREAVASLQQPLCACARTPPSRPCSLSFRFCCLILLPFAPSLSFSSRRVSSVSPDLTRSQRQQPAQRRGTPTGAQQHDGESEAPSSAELRARRGMRVASCSSLALAGSFSLGGAALVHSE